MKTRSTSILTLCLPSFLMVLLGWGCYFFVKYAAQEPNPERPELGR